MLFYRATFVAASLSFIDICDACGSQNGSDFPSSILGFNYSEAVPSFNNLTLSNKSVTFESTVVSYSISGAYNESFQHSNESYQYYHESEVLPAYSVRGYLRRLVGSNCVLIERGTISPYYECIGCDIRTAMGCLTDLRSNKSRNVDPQCTLRILDGGSLNAACCPRFRVAPDTGDRHHLQ